MLKVDLGRLARAGRLEVRGRVSLDDGGGGELPGRVLEELDVELEVQRAVSGDVVAGGTMMGRVEIPCRRCLEPVEVEVAERLTLIYREGVDPPTAHAEEIYPLPERGSDLDLEPAVREHWFLVAPRFALCVEECRGFCEACGANLNEDTCECSRPEADQRWGPLLRLRNGE